MFTTGKFEYQGFLCCDDIAYIIMYVITITSNSANYHTSVVVPTVCRFLQACLGGAGEHGLSGQVAGRIKITQRCHVLQINNIYYGEKVQAAKVFLGYYAGFKLCTFIFQLIMILTIAWDST